MKTKNETSAWADEYRKSFASLLKLVKEEQKAAFLTEMIRFNGWHNKTIMNHDKIVGFVKAFPYKHSFIKSFYSDEMISIDGYLEETNKLLMEQMALIKLATGGETTTTLNGDVSHFTSRQMALMLYFIFKAAGVNFKRLKSEIQMPLIKFISLIGKDASREQIAKITALFESDLKGKDVSDNLDEDLKLIRAHLERFFMPEAVEEVDKH